MTSTPKAARQGSTPFDGLEPISVYTSRQAVEDGILVEPYPDKFPDWLLTRAVFEAVETVQDGRDLSQKLIPLLMDAGWIVRRRQDHLHTKGLEGNVTGQAVWIGANDLGAYTLMFPEDY